MGTLTKWYGGITVVMSILMMLILANCGNSSDTSSEGLVELPAITESQLEGGYVWVTQIAELTEEEMAMLGSELLRVIQEDGWVRTHRGFERSKLIDPVVARELMDIEFTFEVNGQEVPIADDGAVVLPSVIGDTTPARLFVIHSNQREEYIASHVDYNIFIDANGVAGIEIAWFKFGPRAAMHNDNNADENEMENMSNTHALGSLPCLDYNGPAGNCKNYSKYDPRAWVNFIGSDCDWAWGTYGYCWYDDTRYAYCNNTTRNCSPLIGHPQSHHCH